MAIDLTYKSAIITGATGLLGNNLVREALTNGIKVKAIVRNIAKANAQFGNLENLELIEGDMKTIDQLGAHFKNIDVVFHTAAYFRDSYKGGAHWDELFNTNVIGTQKLMQTAYENGVRNMIHVSSIATLAPIKDKPIKENMLRKEDEADDYYKSKILSDKAVLEFVEQHMDFKVSFVLPGWMHGPGDMGPTSAAQLVGDFLAQKLPAIPPGEFSLVDARDVAKICLYAAQKGDNLGRYIAAGRPINMENLLQKLEELSGIKAPTMKAPIPMLRIMAFFGEIGAKYFNRPALVSNAALNLLLREQGVVNYDQSKTKETFDFEFRPMDETLKDEINWLRAQ